MPHSRDNSTVYRVVFGIVLAVLGGFTVANALRYVRSTTDENLFTNSPSRYHIVRSFPVVPDRGDARRAAAAADSIFAGDLLVTLNLQVPSSVAAIDSLIATGRDSASVLQIFRPALNKHLVFYARNSDIPEDFVVKTPPTVVVFQVTPNGASDRAGMKIGDLIYRINRQTFSNMQHADIILRQAQSGKSTEYAVLRDGSPMTLQVTLARFGIRLSNLTVLLCSFLFTGVGAFIALVRPWITGARLQGLGLVLIGYFMSVLSMRRDAVYDDFAQIRDLLVLLSIFYSMAVLAHARMYYPVEDKSLANRRWYHYFPYLWVTPFALSALIRGRAASVPIEVLGALTGVVIFGVVTHFVHRKSRALEAKKLQRLVSVISIAGTFGAFFSGVWLAISGSGNNIGFATLPLAIIPIGTLYLIGRYRLFDLDLRIRRNIEYTIVTTAWGLALLGVFLFVVVGYLPKVDFYIPNIYLTGLAIEVSENPISADRKTLLMNIFLMFTAVLLAFALLRVRRAGQRYINRWYDQGVYDYRTAASQLAEIMGTKVTMVDLAKGIVQKLAEYMYLKRVGVLFYRNGSECCCYEAHGFENQAWKAFCMNIDGELMNVFTRFRSETRFSVDYLPASLKEEFDAQGFKNIILIRSKEQLVGCILVGEKLSESPFNQDDIEFLSTVAKNASVAIENAFLYEELAEQTRLKHELKIARDIQLASLPQKTPVFDDLDIAGISIPALEVGGDYFDYLNGVSRGLTVIVGDVSGKGTSAALYMSKVQGILRSLHGFDLSPRELFIHANRLLYRDLEKKSFVTALGGHFEPGKKELVIARAGHLPLYQFSANDGAVKELAPKGLGLGLDNAKLFADHLEHCRIDYQPGDVYLFLTDGITEAQNEEGEEFGEERVHALLEAHRDLDAAALRDKIVSDVNAFAPGAAQHDDLTVVVVKCR